MVQQNGSLVDGSRWGLVRILGVELCVEHPEAFHRRREQLGTERHAVVRRTCPFNHRPW